MRIVSDKSLNFSWLPCMKHWQSVTVFKMKCSAWVRKMGECGPLLLCSYVSCEHYWYAFINNNVFFYVLFLNLSITWTIESLKKMLAYQETGQWQQYPLRAHTRTPAHSHTCTCTVTHTLHDLCHLLWQKGTTDPFTHTIWAHFVYLNFQHTQILFLFQMVINIYV